MNQLDPVLANFRFFELADTSANDRQFLVRFDQNCGIGGSVDIIFKSFSQVFKSFLDFWMFADQRNTFFARSAKHHAAQVLPVAQIIKSFGLQHIF